MSNDSANKLTVREGLITVTPAERFQDKPRSAPNTCVVVMEKRGQLLRHYCTLHPDRDYRWTIGERVWGDFVCYVVDLRARTLRVAETYTLADRVNTVRLLTTIPYRASDGELVALGVDDALASLHEDVVTLLKRELQRLNLTQIKEEALEERLFRERDRFRHNLGLEISRPQVVVEWSPELIASQKAALEQERARREAEAEQRRARDAQRQQWESDDARRRREHELEEQERRHQEKLKNQDHERERAEWEREEARRARSHRMEKEDLQHLDEVIQLMGLPPLLPEMRTRLLHLDRKEALAQITHMIDENRQATFEMMRERKQKEDLWIEKLIERGLLEPQDLAEFGQMLLKGYGQVPMVDEYGMPSTPRLSSDSRPRLGAEPPAGELPAEPPAGDQP